MQLRLYCGKLLWMGPLRVRYACMHGSPDVPPDSQSWVRRRQPPRPRRIARSYSPPPPRRPWKSRSLRTSLLLLVRGPSHRPHMYPYRCRKRARSRTNPAPSRPFHVPDGRPGPKSHHLPLQLPALHLRHRPRACSGVGPRRQPPSHRLRLLRCPNAPVPPRDRARRRVQASRTRGVQARSHVRAPSHHPLALRWVARRRRE